MNRIYGDNLYNPDIKQRFLEGYRKATRGNYESKLKRASKVEMKYNKDLYNFSLSEIEEVMYLLAPNKLSSATIYGSIIKKYIEWAISQDLRADNLNPLDVVNGKEFYEKFIPKQILIRDDDLELALGQIDSNRDIVIIQSIFEGIMGRECSEIRNLKKQDINQANRTVKLTNVGRYGEVEEREIVISKFLLEAMLRADEETSYSSNFGEGSLSNKKISALKDSSYIIKSTKDEKVKQTLISQTITKFAAKLNMEKLSPVDIRNSGMLKMAKDIYVDKKGKLERTDIHEISKKFNVGSKDGEIFYTTMYTKDFLNIETIIRIYPEVLEVE
ncbi:hypothetical protein L8C07_05640 [Paenibacillus sp. CMAA1739]|uniref:phage lytic cycle repressor MrpR family protein n=1 Tax=Paenibacillus ottowii TaxID=2315729 RepID=UPI002DBF51AE|nr:hypothetical protein [Paenibacillus sp. CMAA1739]MEC4565421.1 hypothetical protein [Paenibacillus sp. CMAA1739]